MADRNTQDVAISFTKTVNRGARNTQDVAIMFAPSRKIVLETQDLAIAVIQTPPQPLFHLKTQAITAWRQPPKIKPRSGFLQNAALLAATPVHPGFVPHILTARRAEAPTQEKRPKRFGPPARRRGQPWAWVITER